MICRRKPIRQVSDARTVDPSPERIRELTAKIRKEWSPRTHARRAAQGAVRVEIMTVAMVEFRDDRSHEV
ncbi:MAG: hypothetical protein DWQ37_16375 [Planctomycetota bacterium]|nr:MAG: hypothetical protein DWQ37_16375 [Planctomycetota bacterium]